MTAEYGSGRFSPVFTSSNVTTAATGGAFSVPQTRTFWLYLLNEAGVSLPSPAVTVTAPVEGRISVSFPEANRDSATGYKYCFVVASLTTTLDDAWVVGFWRLFQADSDAFATAAPIIFSRDEQLVVPPAAVSLPTGLPTGASLVPGMVRLINGGITSGASYYIYYPWLIVDPNSPYFRHSVDGDKVIERSPGEYWVRFGNPNFGLFPIGGDISGDTGACRPLVAVDEEFLAQNLLFGANYAAADNTNSVAVNAKALTVFFGSDTGDDILTGSRFGLNIQVDGFPVTTLFDRRIVVRFLGFYNPVTGILDETSGLADGADMTGIGVDLTQTNAETGFLALSKTLPGNQKAVFKIFPRFRASEIYPPLVQGSVVSIVPILLPQGGVRVPLASIFETSAGGFVAPVGDFGRVVPGDGTLNVLPGLFVVRGHESALQPKQTIVEVTPNTLNQQLAVTQDGRAVVRGVAGLQQLSAGEALLALFDFGTGESVAGPWSNNVVLSGAGGISITATYPVSGAFGQVRSSIAEIGGNTQAHFNPPQVRIYIKQGSTIYRLNSPQPVVIGTPQTFIVTSLTNTTVVVAPDAPPFSDFCLFDPPTVVGSAIGGSLPIGTYQIAIAYSFSSGTQCTRIRQTAADGCIPAYRQSLFESNSSEIIQSIELLSTAGLIERTIGGSAAIVPLSGYIRDFLDDLDAAAARSTLELGTAATRAIGTSVGQIRDAADAAYSDARTPTTHASTHAVGGADPITGFASLVGGVVPTSQLPSFVDDVLEFVALANFPATGESGKIYVATGTGITYRWSGTTYVEISASLALGITSATAYRGDFGNTAYLHSQTTGNPHNTTAAQIGLQNLTNHLQVNTTEPQTIAGAKTFTSPLTLRGDVGILNLWGNTDNYNTFSFTANINTATSYWDFGVGPSSLNRDFYISSGYAGGGFGFRLNATNYNLTLATTTEATSTTAAGFICGGGGGFAKNLFVGGKFCPVSVPSVEWGIDFATGGSTISLASGATYDLATGSGMVVIYDDGNGNFNFMFATGGAVVSAAATASSSIVAGSPATGYVGLFYNSGTAKYRILNNMSTTRTLILSTIKMRAAS